MKTDTGGLALTAGFVILHDSFLCHLLKTHSLEYEHGPNFDFMPRSELYLCYTGIQVCPNEHEIALEYLMFS